MCTSLNFITEDKDVILSRTMDFSFVLEPSVIMIPRNFSWNSSANPLGETYKTTYAFFGMGQQLGTDNVFADGVNEVGLSCASLYFQGYATYADRADVVDDANIVAPHEVVMYLLSTCKTIDEVKKAISEITIVNQEVSLLGLVTPLHWVVTEESGASIVIEPMPDGIKIHENTIGVMTNSPDYEWHMTNMRNYIGVSQTQESSTTIRGVELVAFGQGGGSFAVPGGYTPPARFVRTVLGAAAAEQVTGAEEGVALAFHVLDSVTIPKGNVITQHNVSDYTQYTASMVNTTREYYFKTYDNSQISAVSLMNEDLDRTEPKVWKVSQEQAVHYLNR